MIKATFIISHGITFETYLAVIPKKKDKISFEYGLLKHGNGAELEETFYTVEDVVYDIKKDGLSEISIILKL